MPRYVDEMITRFLHEGSEGVAGAFGKTGDSAGKYGDKLKRVLNTAIAFAPQIQRAGDAVMNFANANVQAYTAAEKIDQTMASMFARRGMEGQVEEAKAFASQLQGMAGINDEVTKSSMGMMASYGMTFSEMKEMMPYLAAQADVFASKGTTVGSVADQIGRALGSGQYGMLSRTGITMDEQTKAILKQATAMRASGDEATVSAGKQMAYNALLKTLRDYTPDITDRMATWQGQQERFNATMDDTKEKMGAGVADVQKYAYAVGYDMLKALNMGSDGMLRFVGQATYLGGVTLKTAGVVVGAARDWKMYRAQIDMAKVITEGATKSKLGLAAATQKDSAAEIAKTGVAKKEAAALLGTANAAKTAAGAKGGLAGAGGFGSRLMGPVGQGGAAATVGQVTLMAGTAILGWEVGGAISKWLDKETGYIDKGADWLTGAKGKAAAAGQAATPAEIAAARKRAAARRQANGDLQITVRGAGLGNQQARDYVNLR